MKKTIESEYWPLWYRYKQAKESGADVKFRDLDEFILWSQKAGYQFGMKLIRLDESEAWSKTNCAWVDNAPNSRTSLRIRKKLVRQWDEFITPIRERYKDWKPPEPPKPKAKEYFRYEHPDLVREGIVWTGG